MMEVPLFNGAVNSHQRVDVQLDSDSVSLCINYVGTYTDTPAWSMDIYQGSTLLAAGVMLEPGSNVIEHYDTGLTGKLICVGDDPTLDNLGTSLNLIWVSDSE